MSVNKKEEPTKWRKMSKNRATKIPAWVRTIVFISCAVVIPVILLLTAIQMGHDSRIVHKTLITTSDIVPIHKTMSKVWCKGQRVSSMKKTGFNAYVMKEEPKENSNKRVVQKFHHEVLLFRGDGVALQFYLLKNSVVTVKFCPNLEGAVINVVKGKGNFKECTYQVSESSKDGNSFELEDYLGDDISSVSSSEQAVLLNPSMEMSCDRSSEYKLLKRSPKCGKHGFFTDHVKIVANTTDSYYILLSSRNILDVIPNIVTMQLTLNKTVYELDNMSPRYSNVSSCEVDYQIGSNDQLLVEVPYNNGSELEVDVISSSCIPRRALYLFLLIPILIIIMVAAFFF